MHDLVVGSQWHPIFLTSEPSPGVWVMKSASDREAFGRIELRRVSVGLRYRVALGGDVIGWSTTLQLACEQLYRANQRARDAVYAGPPNGRR